MKCGKCGEDVVTQPGKSANFCPSCGNKIEAEKASNWQYFDNTQDLLAHIVEAYGLDAMFSKRYLSDHASPMLPQGQKRLVLEAFSCGSVKILQDNMTADQQHKEIAVKQAVKKLTDLMFSQDAAERVVWEFTNAIGWGLPEPKSSAQPQEPPKSQPSAVPQPVPSTTVASGIATLMTRAWQFAEDGDWKEAADYFNKVLDTDATYAPAFLGLLCVDLKVSKEDKLANIKDPNSITNHKYYKRAVTDPALKTQLDSYIQTINARIDAEQKAAAAEAERKRKAAEEAARRKRVQGAFDNACRIMNNAKSPDDYRKAITAFGSIDSNYQDINNQIKSKIAECEKKIVAIETEAERQRKIAEETARKKLEQDLYDVACELMYNAQSPDDYREAITAFSNINSNDQNISFKIKGKIAACEQSKKEMETALDKALAPLRKYFAPEAKAEKQAKLQEKRKSDEASLKAENDKAKADVEAKRAQLQQQYDNDYRTWQEKAQEIKTQYDVAYQVWEKETKRLKAQSETWKAQGLCPHCGGKFGLFGVCKDCKKKAGELLKAPALPAQLQIPSEPQKPQMPTFTPRALDKSLYMLKDDYTELHITIAGIDWIVLDVQDNKVLLIAEKILERRPYHQPVGHITWESCTLRKYLNGEFYNKLGVIRTAIAETFNSNPNNPWYGTSGGNVTTDKVFLLSIEEMIRYFGDSGDLQNKQRYCYENSKYVLKSDGYCLHDQYNATRIATDEVGKAWYWWLRSPGRYRESAATVSYDGSLFISGSHLTDVSAVGGIRPALWLNL